MKYRKFSDLGWNVSEVGLGCWQIGWCWGDVTEHDARELLKKSLDKGINFFDTSDTYGDGRSERFLSEIIKSTSEKFFFAKLFILLNREMFLICGKIRFIISKQSLSLVNFRKPSDFNNF